MTRCTSRLAALAALLGLALLAGCPNGGGEGGAGGNASFTPFVPDDPALIARNNEGVGLMRHFDTGYPQAIEIFQALHEQHPDWLDVKVNLAIATLNRDDEGDAERALEMLEEVIAVAPDHLHAQYCAGILKEYLDRHAEALPHYRLVLEADPDDAYACYRVAGFEQDAGNLEAADTLLRRAIEADPYLASAYYRLSRVALARERPEEQMDLLETFQRLRMNPRKKEVDLKYTKMGPKAEAIAIDLPEAEPAPRPEGPVFAARQALHETELPWRRAAARPVSLTVCDVDGDGALDVFAAGVIEAGAEMLNVALLRGPDGGFAPGNPGGFAATPDVNAALWGDYDNDGLLDVYLCRRGPNQLWRQTAPGTWHDVTATTGTGGGDADTVDGAFVDIDHDGDLDVFCVNADAPNELLSNNLDGVRDEHRAEGEPPPTLEERAGTFRSLGAETDLAGDGRPSRDVVLCDLDRDQDVDVLVIKAEPPHEAYRNELLWSYVPFEGLDALLASDIRAATAADRDADGWPELYALGPDGAVRRWSAGMDGTWSPSPVLEPASGEGPMQIAAADVDGDGTPDLLVSRGDGGAIVRGEAGSEPQAFGGAGSLGWTLAALEPGAGPTIVEAATADAGGGVHLLPAGPGRHGHLHLTLTGQENAGKDMRSNASGVGVHVAARRGSHWTLLDTYPAGAAPGQSLQPVAIGLGGRGHLDYLELDWPDGLLQTEVHGVGDPPFELSAGRLVRVEETQRQSSSCPVVFAWNGERFGFVTDILGVGGIGFNTGFGEYAEPRPWERLLLPAGALAPRDGRLELRLGEPMQETAYFDRLALVAYDLPPGWSMTLDERMGTAPPAPTGRPVPYRTVHAPVAATNDRGADVLEAVRATDDVAAPPGPLDPRFLGRLAGEHVLVLEFDRPLHAGAGAPVLLARGWVEYPYSQTMFAAWQAGASYDPLTIEARGADGRWVTVHDRVGYPAGFPREMSVPLGTLPAGARALRLRTSLEIYWDRLAVVEAEPCPEVRTLAAPLLEASVRRVGFPRRTNGPQRRPHYDYDDRDAFWDARHHTGSYTAYGPAAELVRQADGALAIIGPGEEVRVSFQAPQDGPPAGWTRRWVLEAEGWCKDMDLYTADRETVGPLPATPADRGASRLHETLNTRVRWYE